LVLNMRLKGPVFEIILSGTLLLWSNGLATPARAQTANDGGLHNGGTTASAQANAAASADAEASALLAKARDLVNLYATGPFRLKARVRLYALAHNAASTGTYTLEWAAPDRWREEFAFPGYTETNVVSGEKLWRLRNVPYRPLRVWQLTWLMDVPAHVTFEPNKESALAASKELDNGVPLTCVKSAEDKWTSQRDCVETASGRPLFIELASPGITELYHYMDYAPFGDKVFPRTLRYSYGGVIDVEAKVDELEPLTAAAGQSLDSLFTPPQGAISRQWCANRTPATEIKDTFKKIYPAPRAGRVTLDMMIGADGHVHDAYVLESMDLATDGDARGVAKRSQWHPAMCGNWPIEEEKIMQIHFLEHAR
jgi:hypothetical protein